MSMSGGGLTSSRCGAWRGRREPRRRPSMAEVFLPLALGVAQIDVRLGNRGSRRLGGVMSEGRMETH
uniref:Uncharacterized protein n=2 Tax=Oryza TaxID=4527 RepID=A0A0E0Q0B6_ORYRU